MAAPTLYSIIEKTQEILGATIFPTQMIMPVYRVIDTNESNDVELLCRLTKSGVVACITTAQVPSESIITISSMLHAVLSMLVPGYTGPPPDAVEQQQQEEQQQKGKGGLTEQLRSLSPTLVRDCLAISLREWAPPPGFTLPLGFALDAILSSPQVQALCVLVLNDVFPIVGNYFSASQKASLDTNMDKVINPAYLGLNNNGHVIKWTDKLYSWKAKLLSKSDSRYHSLCILPQRTADGAAQGADPDAINAAMTFSMPEHENSVIDALRVFNTENNFGWSVSAITRLETRRQQSESIELEKTKQASAMAEQASLFNQWSGAAASVHGGGGDRQLTLDLRCG